MLSRLGARHQTLPRKWDAVATHLLYILMDSALLAISSEPILHSFDFAVSSPYNLNR